LGTLVLTETNEYGCVTITEEYEVTIDDCTGIKEIESGQVKVYPNPATNQVNIEFVLSEPAAILVRVMNQIGQLVYQSTENMQEGNQLITVELENLSKGFYTIQLKNAEGSSMQTKFTKID